MMINRMIRMMMMMLTSWKI